MSVDLPPNADVKVYYRTNEVGSSEDFFDQRYYLVTPEVAMVQNNDGQFYDVEYSVTDMVPFDAISAKIVFNSTNSAKAPRIKDLRIIACA
jgi:hypothetical protein